VESISMAYCSVVDDASSSFGIIFLAIASLVGG
jgi:hypothetical protein